MFFSSLRIYCVTIIGVIIIIVNGSNVAVMIVRVIFIGSFFFYCFLSNRSFPTNSKQDILTAFKLYFLSIYKLYKTTFAQMRFVYFWYFEISLQLEKKAAAKASSTKAEAQRLQKEATEKKNKAAALKQRGIEAKKNSSVVFGAGTGTFNKNWKIENLV